MFFSWGNYSKVSLAMEVEDKCVFLIIVMQKYVKKALEWRQEMQQKSICAVRTQQCNFKPRSESDTLYLRLGL